MSDTAQRTLASFLEEMRAVFAQHADAELRLSKLGPAAPAALQRVSYKPVVIKGERLWQRLTREQTRDLTANLSPDDALADVAAHIGTRFLQANASAAGQQWQLMWSKKGRCTVVRQGQALPQAKAAEAPLTHDRVKQRWIPQDRPFLQALGVTDARHAIVPAMSRKWKQINKFVEVLDAAIAKAGLGDAPIHALDFGSGKGYLTFALHDHLQRLSQAPVQVTGVELRSDMVALCEEVVRRCQLTGLNFVQGDVGTHAPAKVNIMVALHACDTATDHAIHYGMRAGAEVIVCSPCCHKEVRPQLLSPHPLKPLLAHGIHLGQQAEMVTDGLRALLLASRGYDTQVFEFVALEHTAKNKMILAVKKGGSSVPDPEILQQIEALKHFYGVKHHTLEWLLNHGEPKA